MSSGLPAFHLYCGDLWKDNQFRLCGWQAQNLWLRMLLILHEHTPRGEFRLQSGEPMTDEQVAKLCEMPIADYMALSAELDSNGVFSRIAGAIANRRMVKERQVNETKRNAGIKGADVRWHNAKHVNSTTSKQKIAEETAYSSSSSSSSSISDKKDTVRWREQADVFWQVYPRKTGKGNVEKWFQRHTPTGELVEKMLAKITELKGTHNWQKDNGQFIPLPYTWLNGKRWDDELPDPPKRHELKVAL
jgi:hypothetical protein